MSKLGNKESRVLSRLLREVRINAGFRQVDLAEELGVPQSLISKYEVAERRIDLLEVREICSVLGLPFTEFVQLFEKRLSEECG